MELWTGNIAPDTTDDEERELFVQTQAR